jgi:hypothetical protein
MVVLSMMTVSGKTLMTRPPRKTHIIQPTYVPLGAPSHGISPLLSATPIDFANFSILRLWLPCEHMIKVLSRILKPHNYAWHNSNVQMKLFLETQQVFFEEQLEVLWNQSRTEVS